MPIYEYECQQCERHVEVMQRISDPPLTECSECGGELKKLISAPAFQFKGSGWYVTDYAKKDRGKEKGGEEKSSSSDGSEKSGGSSSSSSSDSGSSSASSTSSKDD